MVVVHGLENAGRMAWEVLWALALGFILSGIVQAWVPRRRIERALGGEGAREIGIATGLGAASSSCSYAAVAIAKSLFTRGASLQSAMAFQFASTNLVFELGIAIWVLLGWQFTVAEFVGGLLLIVLMWILVRLLVSKREERAARAHAETADAGHQHHSASAEGSLKDKVASADAWSDVALNVRGDVGMLWKEILAGFVIAGFVALLPQRVFNDLFLRDASTPLRVAENVLVAPLVAALSFVCSVGNVPLAAVLWGGGASFAGVLAFIYADLVIVPLVLVYRKVYGSRVAAKLVLAMTLAMVLAALAVDGIFAALGITPDRPQQAKAVAEKAVAWDATTVLNLLALAALGALFALMLRRGAKDPVCGMTVDRRRAKWRSGGHVFCSEHCLRTFESGAAEHAHQHSHAH
jgi:uncharacterized membrane protein YraQ (UPF0718 family)/YHS domain-containing protein